MRSDWFEDFGLRLRLLLLGLVGSLVGLTVLACAGPIVLLFLVLLLLGHPIA